MRDASQRAPFPFPPPPSPPRPPVQRPSPPPPRFPPSLPLPPRRRPPPARTAPVPTPYRCSTRPPAMPPSASYCPPTARASSLPRTSPGSWPHPGCRPRPPPGRGAPAAAPWHARRSPVSPASLDSSC